METELSSQLLVGSLIGAVAASISAFVTLYLAGARRRQMNAETSLSLVQSASEVATNSLALANELQEERAEVTRARQDLEVQLASLQAEISELKAGISALADQLRELGHEPVWNP